MQNLLSNPLTWVALAVFIIARQFLPRQVQPAWMVGLPVVAGFLGVQALVGSPPAGVPAVALLAINLLLGAAMGLARGATVRIWQSAGGAWMTQGTPLTFVFWLVSIGLHVALGFATHAAFETSEIGLFVAVTFAAQNMVVAGRMTGWTPAALARLVGTYDRAG